MSLMLAIRLPDGEIAPVFAGAWETLCIAMQIVDGETGQKGSWARLAEPHTTLKSYSWDVAVGDETRRVELPEGSTIGIYG